MITGPITRRLTRPPTAAVTKAVGGAAPTPEFDYIMAVGSSTTFQCFGLHALYGRQEHVMRKIFTDQAMDIPLINKAVSGSDIAALDANINTYLRSIAGSTKKFGVLINIGSNDIGTTSFASMSQGTKDAMLAGLNSIIDKIVAAGHTPIVATVHSRSGYADMYETWAVGMYRPLCQAESPLWFRSPLAVFDYCRLYQINQAVPNWWQADGLHPEQATTPYQTYTAQQIKSSVKTPALDPKEKFVFSLRGTAPNIGGINTKTVTASAGSMGLGTVVNSNGVLVAGANFSWGASGGPSVGARGNPGIFDVAVDNNDVMLGAIFRSAGPVPFTFAAGAAYAGRTGTMRIAASATGTPRITKYTFGDATTAVLDLSTGVPVVSHSFTMDGSGNYVFSMAPEAPSTFCHMSAVEFVFT